MELKHLKTYNHNDINNLLLSPSGAFYDENGKKITKDDLKSVYDFYKGVMSGDYSTVSLPKFILREYKKGREQADNVGAYEHLVLEDVDIPADREQEYLDTIKKSISKIKYGFYQSGQLDFIAGERQVFLRLETSESGHKHLHILLNQRGIVDIKDLEAYKTLDSSDDFNKPIIDGAEKAIKNERYSVTIPTDKNGNLVDIENAEAQFNASYKVDKFLTSTIKLANNYNREAFRIALNRDLKEAGFQTLPEINGYSVKEGSNVKTSSETKQAFSEIIKEGYSEEAVEKAVSDIINPKHSAFDSIAISTAIQKNNDELKELTERAKRIAAENRQLQEAYAAIQDLQIARNEIDELKKAVESKDSKIEELEISIENEKQLNKQEIEALNAKHSEDLEEININHKQEIAGKDSLIEEEKEKNNKLSEELENLQEQAEIDSAEIENLKKSIQEKDIFIESQTNMVNQYKGMLEQQNMLTEQQAKMLAEQSKQIKEQQRMFEEQQKLFKEQQEQFKAEREEHKEVLQTLNGEIEQLKHKDAETQAELGELKTANQKLLTAMQSFKSLADNLSKTYAKAINALKGKLKANQAVKKEIEPEIKKFEDEVKIHETHKKTLESDNALKAFFNKKNEPAKPQDPHNKPKA